MSIKSKSLTNIVDAQRADMIRSRSTIPINGHCSLEEQENQKTAPSLTMSSSNDAVVTCSSNNSSPLNKPKLTKQKQHVIMDDTYLDDLPEDTANEQSIGDKITQSVSNCIICINCCLTRCKNDKMGIYCTKKK